MARDDLGLEPTLDEFSQVVDAIYDCALDPDCWQVTVRSIADLSESRVCILGVHDDASGRSELTYRLGYDDERFIRLHGERLQPIGAVTTRAMLIDDQEFWESGFYQEWCKPQHDEDMSNFKMLQTEHRIGWLAAHRLDTCPRYGDTEVRLWTLLSPHVCRSIAVSDALNLRTVRSEALEATLDALAAGVYLVDRHARIIYMNRAAERQLGTSAALCFEDGRLAPADPEARIAMDQAIQQAMQDESEAPAGGLTIALPGSKSRGLVATILPLRGKRRNVCGAFAATAAVFVQDPVVISPFPGEAFAKLYGLTGGELRVLLAMAPGLSVKEAAEVLGIGENTAKTHLQHIYIKTGTSKQTELMHLFMSSTPPVRMA